MSTDAASSARRAGPPAGALLTPRGVTLAGLGVNAALGVAKVIAGVLTGSQAIFADGLHSASDLVTDVAVLAGLRISDKPADDCHPYGHRRVSTLVAMFVGAGLLIAAGLIVYNAIVSVRQVSEPMTSWAPLGLALLTIPLKEILYRLTRRVGRRFHDPALRANAWHHRSDAFSSVAAAAGLAGAKFGGAQWAFLDPLTAIVLSTFLVSAAVRIMRESAAELVDRSPGEGTMDDIARAVAATPGVRGYHAFRARGVGGKIDMDIHIQVDPDLTVREGHDIATAVRQSVEDADERVVQAIVHIEPAEESGEGATAPP